MEAESELRSIERILARIDQGALDRLNGGVAGFSTLVEGERLLGEIKKQKLLILRSSVGKAVRVLPFSRVRLDLASFSLASEGRKTDFTEEKNPFSIGDQLFNRFTFEKIEGDEALGTLQIIGDSEFFAFTGCRHNVICVPGTFRNVAVPLERLDPSTLR
jgi:hypothetical protein